MASPYPLWPLALAAEGQNPAQTAAQDGFVHPVRVAARLTRAVDRPALGHGLSAFVVNLHLAQRHHRRGCVEPEGIRIGGHTERHRIRAQHHLAPERRHHDRPGVGHRKRRQSLALGHQRVIARNAVMRRVAHHDHADARRFRLLNGHAHRLRRRQVPHREMAVHQRGNRRFAQNLRPRAHIDTPAFDVLVVIHHPLRAMALDAEQIRLHQHVGNLSGFFRLKALFFVGALHKRAQRFFRNSRVAHGSFLLYSL